MPACPESLGGDQSRQKPTEGEEFQVFSWLFIFKTRVDLKICKAVDALFLGINLMFSCARRQSFVKGSIGLGTKMNPDCHGSHKVVATSTIWLEK